MKNINNLSIELQKYEEKVEEYYITKRQITILQSRLKVLSKEINSYINDKGEFSLKMQEC